MLGDLSGVQKIFIVTGRTDMRKSFEGLMAIIRDTFQLDPFSSSVFLFCGRRTDTLKALYYDKDGFVLMQKRLNGGTFPVAPECIGSQAANQTGIPVAHGRAFHRPAKSN